MKNLKILVFGAVFSILFISTFTSCENNDVQPALMEDSIAENVKFQNSPLRGPIIKIELGRKKKGCEGFGICKISIGSALSLDSSGDLNTSLAYDRRTSAYYFDALLSKDSRINDAALVVDEDIVVDYAEQSLKVSAGMYTVDQSLGENGGYRIYFK